MIYKSGKEKNSDAGAAYNAALRFLTRREYSYTELSKKLYERYTKDAAVNALERCRASGYQSDERYADMIARHYASNYYGPMKLIYVAREKGIDISLIQSFIDETSWSELAFRALKKKYGDMHLEYEMRIKALNFLQRRGFLKDQCISALNEYVNLLK